MTDYQPIPAADFKALDLLANIAQAIDADTDIRLWAQDNYGRGLLVFAGSDPEAPPDPETEYPMVELAAIDDHDSATAEFHARLIGVEIGVHDPEKTPVGYGGLQLQRGVLRLEQLCGLIFTAISAADLDGGYIDQVVLRRDLATVFPNFKAGMFLHINKARWPYKV